MKNVKFVFAVLAILCAITAYFLLAVGILVCIAVVIPWALTSALLPVLADCSVFCMLMVLLLGLGLFAVVIFFTIPVLCGVFPSFYRWLVVKLL